MNGKLEFRKGGLRAIFEAAGIELNAEAQALVEGYDRLLEQTIDNLTAIIKQHEAGQRLERTAASVGLTVEDYQKSSPKLNLSSGSGVGIIGESAEIAILDDPQAEVKEGELVRLLNPFQFIVDNNIELNSVLGHEIMNTPLLVLEIISSAGKHTYRVRPLRYALNFLLDRDQFVPANSQASGPAIPPAPDDVDPFQYQAHKEYMEHIGSPIAPEGADKLYAPQRGDIVRLKAPQDHVDEPAQILNFLAGDLKVVNIFPINGLYRLQAAEQPYLGVTVSRDQFYFVRRFAEERS